MTDTIRLQIASPRITAMMIRPIHLRESGPSDVNVFPAWSIILLPLRRLLHTNERRETSAGKPVQIAAGVNIKTKSTLKVHKVGSAGATVNQSDEVRC